MKQEQPGITINHCFCNPNSEPFEIPVSYSPTSSKIKMQTLIDTSDDEEDLRIKFQRYNPNLGKYLSNDSKPLHVQANIKHKKSREKKQQKIVYQKKQSVNNQSSNIVQKKTFQFKKFSYMDQKQKCSCDKPKFTKFIWKPIFTSGYYKGTIPQYHLDQNNIYTPVKKVNQNPNQMKQHSVQKINATTQTNKQYKPQKPAVSFDDFSQVSPPKIKQPMKDIIPQQLIENPNKYYDKKQQQQIKITLPPQKQQKYQQQQIPKSIQKVKGPQSSVFKQFHDNKYYKYAQQKDQICDCPCHTKICGCIKKMKKSLLDQATYNPNFANRLMSNAHSDVCQCISAECHCNCGLKYYQLPQYRLNPQNYQILPSNQMNQIPYAGKVRRYDFNVK